MPKSVTHPLIHTFKRLNRGKNRLYKQAFRTSTQLPSKHSLEKTGVALENVRLSKSRPACHTTIIMDRKPQWVSGQTKQLNRVMTLGSCKLS